MRAVFVLVFAAAMALAQPVFRAGVASRSIRPDLQRFNPIYIAGSGKDRKTTGVHDDIPSRYVAYSAPKSGVAPLVICGVDSMGIFWEDTLRVRKALTGKGIAYSGLILAASHSHPRSDTMGLWGPGC